MSQIIKRFIGDNQVGAAKIELENNAAIAALNSVSASTDLLKLNASDVLEFLLLPQYSGSPLATQGYVGTQLGSYIPSSEKGANDGVAELDSNGKVPIAQLPNSVMEYQGAFDPTGPTPNLANGSGNAGDVYIVSVAGSHDFGAGAISFGVGDWVIYNGTIWEKASNSISANSVDGSLIRLANNQALRARNAANNADFDLLKVDTSNHLKVGFSTLANVEIGFDGSNALYFETDYAGLYSSSALEIYGDTLDFGYSNATPLIIKHLSTTGHVAFQVPNTVTTYSVTWPSAGPSAGNVMVSDGSGILSWTALPAGATWAREEFTLSAGDITAGEIDLANTPINASIIMVVGGLVSLFGTDYTMSGVTLDFSGHTPALIAGDVVTVQYQY